MSSVENIELDLLVQGVHRTYGLNLWDYSRPWLLLALRALQSVVSHVRLDAVDSVDEATRAEDALLADISAQATDAD